MTSDLDSFRTAKLLVDQHGDEAPIYAAMRTHGQLARDDLDGQANWKLILKAIDDLLANERPERQRFVELVCSVPQRSTL